MITLCLVAMIMIMTTNAQPREDLWYYKMDSASTDWSGDPSIISSFGDDCPNSNGKDYCWDTKSLTIQWDQLTGSGLENYHTIQLVYSLSATGVSATKECILEYSINDPPISFNDIFRTAGTDILPSQHNDQSFSFGGNPSVLSIRLTSTGGNTHCFTNEFTVSGIPITSNPTGSPTAAPSASPSNSPSASTITPTAAPSASPTNAPSASPTNHPSAQPSVSPTAHPSLAPTHNPSAQPSLPTNAPSVPTITPTVHPSLPTNTPTAPTMAPTTTPTATPSAAPSNSPSAATATPTAAPSVSPTAHPSLAPTHNPSAQPSVPTNPPTAPTITPTAAPSAPTTPPTTNPTAIEYWSEWIDARDYLSGETGYWTTTEHNYGPQSGAYISEFYWTDANYGVLYPRLSTGQRIGGTKPKWGYMGATAMGRGGPWIAPDGQCFKGMQFTFQTMWVTSACCDHYLPTFQWVKVLQTDGTLKPGGGFTPKARIDAEGPDDCITALQVKGGTFGASWHLAHQIRALFRRNMIAPSLSPTAEPSAVPTMPSKHPTQFPSAASTDDPTVSPTAMPTNTPSLFPIAALSAIPTMPPSKEPTQFPSDGPTNAPTTATTDPTTFPTMDGATVAPTEHPTTAAIKAPTTDEPTTPFSDREAVETYESSIAPPIVNNGNKPEDALLVNWVLIGIGAVIVLVFCVLATFYLKLKSIAITKQESNIAMDMEEKDGADDVKDSKPEPAVAFVEPHMPNTPPIVVENEEEVIKASNTDRLTVEGPQEEERDHKHNKIDSMEDLYVIKQASTLIEIEGGEAGGMGTGTTKGGHGTRSSRTKGRDHKRMESRTEGRDHKRMGSRTAGKVTKVGTGNIHQVTDDMDGVAPTSETTKSDVVDDV